MLPADREYVMVSNCPISEMRPDAVCLSRLASTDAASCVLDAKMASINLWRKARTNHTRIRDLTVFPVCSPPYSVYYQYINHRKDGLKRGWRGYSCVSVNDWNVLSAFAHNVDFDLTSCVSASEETVRLTFREKRERITYESGFQAVSWSVHGYIRCIINILTIEPRVLSACFRLVSYRC